MFFLYVIWLMILFANNIHSQSNEIIDNTNIIDVVIPSIEANLPTLSLCINSIRKYGKNVRRIIVISDKKLTDEAEWFDEKKFEFSKFDIAYEIFQNKEKAIEYIKHKNSRIGWLYQQLLKLYAPITIPGISPNVLILDSDTVFFKPISFFDEEGRALYNIGNECEHHEEYFEHMRRLLPSLRKVYRRYSGISHHMIFQRNVIEELCTRVQEIHNVELWKAMSRCINHKYLFHSAYSEYEIYFNFIFDRQHYIKAKIRPLKYANTNRFNDIEKVKKEGYDYGSCHVHVPIFLVS